MCWWVLSLGWKDSLKEGVSTQSSSLAWKIPCTEKLGGLRSIGLKRVGHDWVTKRAPTVQQLMLLIAALLCWLGLFFKDFFLMWTIFKVFIEFAAVLLLFYVLFFWPRGMWDLRSPTRDWTSILGIGRLSLNHWTAREVPAQLLCLLLDILGLR